MKKSDERHEVDWNEVHRRLESVQQALDRQWRPLAEEKAEILKKRAKALAREAEVMKAPGETIQLIEFLLADEHYGIESAYIREIQLLKALTPLPCTPPFVFGIINLRGQILAIIDIKKFFGLPAKGLSSLNKVIILHSNEMEFGILADAVLDVRAIPLAGIQPALPTLTDTREAYLKGITKERLIILDAAKLLSDPRIIVHEEVEG